MQLILIVSRITHLLSDSFGLLKSRRARPFLVLSFAVDSALIFVMLVCIQNYLPEDYGGGSGLPGYVLAAYGVAKLGGQFLAGRLVDRLTPRKALVTGVSFIFAGQLALLAAAVTPFAAIPAASVYGLGSAAIWPAMYSLAGREFEARELGKLSSGLTMSSGAGVVMALGLGFLLPSGFPYLAAMGLSLIAAAGAYLVARSFPDAVRKEAEPAEQAWDMVESLSGTVREILEPRRLIFSVMLILQCALLAGLLAVFRTYGRDLLHVSFREEVLLLAPAAAAGAAAVVVGGTISDRVGRIPVLGCGFMFAGFGIWGLSTLDVPLVVMPLAVLAALGLGLALPSMNAVSLDLSRTEAGSGAILGWFLTMEGIGYVLGPAGAGWVSEKAGVAVVFWLAGGTAAVLCVLALVPPMWSNLSFSPAAPVRRLNVALSAGLKGALVFSFVFPVAATYAAWSPSSQLYGDITTHGPRDEMRVAITFDDGPNQPWTMQVADVLDQHGVKATFFIIGQNADADPGTVRELVRRGHLVENHSYHHRKRDAVLEFRYGEVTKAERAIASAAGVCPAFYRPPNGFHVPWQLHSVSDHHLRTVNWDVIPRDWKNLRSDVIVKRVLDGVRPGSIILLHDGDNTNQGTDRSATLGALPGIVEGLQAKGYEIVRLDELLSAPPYLSTCDGLAEQAHG